MSIRIQKSKCAGCGRCIEACPGNLIITVVAEDSYPYVIDFRTDFYYIANQALDF